VKNSPLKWRWPEDKEEGSVPWWVILRRAVVFPFLFSSFALTLFFLFCAFGKADWSRSIDDYNRD
jgi:hypothetical protein